MLLAVALSFSATSLTAQSDKREEKRLERAEKKKIREQQYATNKEGFLSLVNERSFVIEANALYGRYMNRYEVIPSTNFVKVEGDIVTLQTAHGFSQGYNGLGGVTINGKITRYEIKESEKNHSLQIAMAFTSPALGHCTLNMNIAADGTASARIRDNWGGRAVFSGEIISLDTSSVFEGMSIM